MHNDALIRLVEDVRKARTDVVEQSDRVPKEVGRPKNAVDLCHELLLVMKLHALLEGRDTESDVLEEEGAEVYRCCVHVTESHGKGVHGVIEGVSRRHSVRSLARHQAVQGKAALLIDIDAISPHEG